MNEKNIYLQRYEKFTQNRKKLEKTSGQISNLRLATIITGVLLSVIAYYYAGKPLSYMTAGIFLIIFSTNRCVERQAGRWF